MDDERTALAYSFGVVERFVTTVESRRVPCGQTMIRSENPLYLGALG
jgi:hypothetical protein